MVSCSERLQQPSLLAHPQVGRGMPDTYSLRDIKRRVRERPAPPHPAAQATLPPAGAPPTGAAAPTPAAAVAAVALSPTAAAPAAPRRQPPQLVQAKVEPEPKREPPFKRFRPGAPSATGGEATAAPPPARAPSPSAPLPQRELPAGVGPAPAGVLPAMAPSNQPRQALTGAAFNDFVAERVGLPPESHLF